MPSSDQLNATATSNPTPTWRKPVAVLTSMLMAAAMLVLGVASPAAAVTVEDIAPTRVIEGPNTGFNTAGGASGLAQDNQGNLIVGTNAVDDRDWNGIVRTFGRDASGDASPVRSFGPYVRWPVFLTTDANNYLVQGTGGDAQVQVFRPQENQSFGNLRPERVIKGRPGEYMGRLWFPAVDAQGYIYVSWANAGVRVYAPGANGAVAPVRVITDDGTGSMASMSGIHVDPDGTLYVRARDRISVYEPGVGAPCNGNDCVNAPGAGVKPNRVITGPNTYMDWSFIGVQGAITVDSAGSIYVTGQFVSFSQSGERPQRILVFPPGANGNVAPSRIIAGPKTGLRQIRGAVINPDGELVVSDNLTKRVSVFGAVAAQPPEPPVNIDAIPGLGQATIKFDSGGNGTEPITKYEYSINRGASWVEVGLPPNNTFDITGLTDGTTYELLMRATSSVGVSGQSIPVKFTPGAPQAPTKLVAVPGVTSAEVSFTPPPVLEGQAPITNYEYRISEFGPWVPLNPAATGSPVTIPGLNLAAGGPEFNIALRAVNSAGAGDPSAEVTVVVKDVPPSPLDLQLTDGDASAELNFAPPLVDPSVPLTMYQYTVDGTNWIDAPLTLPLRITGLTNGQTYPVQVRGVNSLGVGEPSAVVEANPFRTATIPDVPEIVAAQGANEIISVEFIEGFDGGSPITNYEYSLDDGATWEASFPPVIESPLTIKGVTNGQTYSVRIRAVNEVGASDPSAPVSVTVPIPTTISYTGVGTVPVGQSVMLQALVFDKTANPPTPLAGRDVTFTFGGKTYTAVTNGSGVAEVTSDPVTESIGVGMLLRVSVSATANATGDETTSTIEVVSAGVPAVVTEAPSGVTSTQATLNGKVNANGQESTVVFRYSSDPDFADALEVEAIPSPVTGVTETAVTAQLERLVPGQNYFVRMVATNGDGTAEGEVEKFTAAAAAPDVATLPAGEVTDASALLNASVNPRGADTTELSLKYSTDQGVVDAGGGTAAPIDPEQAEGIIPLNVFGAAEELRAATTYYYRVSATNSVGTGTGDTLEFTTGEGAPEAPVDPIVTPGYQQAQVSFTPGYDGGSPITGYEYSIDDGATWVKADVTASPITITGLTNGVLYPVKIRAINEIGSGAETATLFVMPEGAGFVPIDPVRAYDSRTGAGPLAGGSSRVIDVSDTAGVPQDAVAVAYNLTVTGMQGSGYLTVAPGDTEDLPLASTINYSAEGQMWANGYVTDIDEGRMKVFAQGAATQFVVDVVGYYQATPQVKGAAVAPEASLFVPITPLRAYDSRDIGAGGPLFDGQKRTVNITAGGQIPAEATAVAYTLTETGTSGRGWLAVGPAGEAQPAVSSINWFTDNQTSANSSVVAVNDGQVTVYAGSSTPGGNSEFVIDILGFYVPESDQDWDWAGRFTGLEPQRAYDSRTDDPSGPIGGGEAFVTPIAVPGVPNEAVAVAFNLTETGTKGSGYLTSTPGDTASPPVASTINWWESNQTIANGSTVAVDGIFGPTLEQALLPLASSPLRNGESSYPLIKTFAGGGSTQYVLDIGGYFHFDIRPL